MAESSLAQLPDDIDALKALISARDSALAEQYKKLAEQNKKLSERDKKITILEEYVRLLKSHCFGKSSERFVSDLQESLFNEAEQLDDKALAEAEAPAEAGDVAEADSASPLRTTTAPNKKSAPAAANCLRTSPREVIHELPQGERQCPCGCQMAVFERQLCIIPADLYVIQHCRQKYRCTACEDKAPVTAPMPAQPFPKATPVQS